MGSLRHYGQGGQALGPSSVQMALTETTQPFHMASNPLPDHSNCCGRVIVETEVLKAHIWIGPQSLSLYCIGQNMS